MPTKRLYVGNIPYSTTEDELRILFADFKLVDVVVVSDRETGRAKGFAFVETATVEDAYAAMERLHGAELKGRSVIVNFAKDRESRPQRSEPRPQKSRPRRNAR